MTEGHVDAMSTDELVTSFRATVVDRVIAGLTVERRSTATWASPPPEHRRLWLH